MEGALESVFEGMKELSIRCVVTFSVGGMDEMYRARRYDGHV